VGPEPDARALATGWHHLSASRTIKFTDSSQLRHLRVHSVSTLLAPLLVTVVAGVAGDWRVDRIEAVRGAGLERAARLAHTVTPPRILVTGATGFIGREVVRRFWATGRPVLVMARARAEVTAEARVAAALGPAPNCPARPGARRRTSSSTSSAWPPPSPPSRGAPIRGCGSRRRRERRSTSSPSSTWRRRSSLSPTIPARPAGPFTWW
jgi:hypothetical protein